MEEEERFWVGERQEVKRGTNPKLIVQGCGKSGGNWGERGKREREREGKHVQSTSYDAMRNTKNKQLTRSCQMKFESMEMK